MPKADQTGAELTPVSAPTVKAVLTVSIYLSFCLMRCLHYHGIALVISCFAHASYTCNIASTPRSGNEFIE